MQDLSENIQDLFVVASNNTPLIEAKWLSGEVKLEGDSYPENSFDFFQPFINWLEAYLKENQQGLSFQVSLAYLNTSSVRVMVDLLDMLEDAFKTGHPVSLVWYYEAGNERVAELAEEFKEDCSFPFSIEARST